MDLRHISKWLSARESPSVPNPSVATATTVYYAMARGDGTTPLSSYLITNFEVGDIALELEPLYFDGLDPLDNRAIPSGLPLFGKRFHAISLNAKLEDRISVIGEADSDLLLFSSTPIHEESSSNLSSSLRNQRWKHAGPLYPHELQLPEFGVPHYVWHEPDDRLKIAAQPTIIEPTPYLNSEQSTFNLICSAQSPDRQDAQLLNESIYVAVETPMWRKDIEVDININSLVAHIRFFAEAIDRDAKPFELGNFYIKESPDDRPPSILSPSATPNIEEPENQPNPSGESQRRRSSRKTNLLRRKRFRSRATRLEPLENRTILSADLSGFCLSAADSWPTYGLELDSLRSCFSLNDDRSNFTINDIAFDKAYNDSTIAFAENTSFCCVITTNEPASEHAPQQKNYETTPTLFPMILPWMGLLVFLPILGASVATYALSAASVATMQAVSYLFNEAQLTKRGATEKIVIYVIAFLLLLELLILLNIASK